MELKLKGDISVEELCTYRTVSHKSCHLKFANSKLERAQQKIKRKSTADSSSQTRKAKRQVSDKNVCIFCDEQGNDLHQVLTLEVDVNEMAIQMQDCQMIAKYHSRCMEKMKNSSPKKLSADCWPTVGRQLDDSRTTVGRQSDDSRPTVGQLLTDCRLPPFTQIFCQQSADCWPFVGRLSAACR